MAKTNVMERPFTMSNLTKKQFDAELLKGINEIENGQIITADNVEDEMEKYVQCFNRNKQYSLRIKQD